MTEYRLGVDYGTSNSVAVLRWPDGRQRLLLFDGAPLLPSAVFAGPDGLVTGRDAEHSARLDPACFEANPKRRIDEGRVLLGAAEVEVVDLVAATLRRIAAEARRTAGGPPTSVTVSCPAGWGAARRGVLLEAADRADLPVPTLLPEPVAAAAFFATLPGRRVEPGRAVVVYDLGAGTFDVSVVLRHPRHPDEFEVRDVDGIADFGGLDLDALVVERVGAAVAGSAPVEWQRLSAPATPADRRDFRLLWDDARAAKEMLSRTASAGVHVPLIDRDVHVTREEFEAAARPGLQRAADLTAEVMRRAGITADNLAGLFLVGGSSRVPLVATLLHRTTGVAPTVIEQPEVAVAEGCVRVSPPASVPRAADERDAPAAVPTRRKRRLPLVAAIAAAIVLLAATATAYLIGILPPGEKTPPGGAGSSPPGPRFGGAIGKPCSLVPADLVRKLIPGGVLSSNELPRRVMSDYNSTCTWATEIAPSGPSVTVDYIVLRQQDGESARAVEDRAARRFADERQLPGEFRDLTGVGNGAHIR